MNALELRLIVARAVEAVRAMDPTTRKLAVQSGFLNADDCPECCGPVQPCARCGESIDGLGIIGADRYCHPDDAGKPDCYTLTCRELGV